MQIHARFSLQETTRIKMYAPPKEPKPGGEKWEVVHGVRVKLSPVQGEPFGSATPGGQLEMVIANPAAARLFHEAEIGQEFDAVFSPVPVVPEKE
jgi:hypothetical protein